MIKTDVTVTSYDGKLKVSELIKFTEKLKAMYPKDQEYYYVEILANGLSACDEEEH